MKGLFALSNLLSRRDQTNQPYFEFLRVPTLSAGIYVLQAGAEDQQQPHSEDEVYYVVSGSGTFQMESEGAREDHPVAAGAIIFVKAGVRHRFHTITEELALVVFFAPAESI